MVQCTTNAEKLAWLRQYADPDLPDAYNMKHLGFIPNGCGPESWKLGSVQIPSDKKIKILGLDFTLRLVPNKFIGMPPVEIAGDYHDYHYWLGGLESNRKHADKMLVWIMRELVRQDRHWWSMDSVLDTVRMDIISTAFYLAVRRCGSAHFSYKPEGEVPPVPDYPVYAASF